MKNIWKNHKFFVLSVSYFGLACLIIYFLLIPFIKKIENRTGEIQRKIIDNSLDEAKLKNIDELEEQYKYFQDKGDVLDVVIDSQEEVSFIEKLESLSSETGNAMTLKVLDAEAGKLTDKNKKSDKKKEGEKSIVDSLAHDKYLNFQINLRGSYAGLIKFIYKLENSYEYVNVVGLDIKKEKDSSKESFETDVRRVNVFTASPSGSEPAVDEKAEEKEIINSIINIVVYLKK